MLFRLHRTIRSFPPASNGSYTIFLSSSQKKVGFKWRVKNHQTIFEQIFPRFANPFAPTSVYRLCGHRGYVYSVWRTPSWLTIFLIFAPGCHMGRGSYPVYKTYFRFPWLLEVHEFCNSANSQSYFSKASRAVLTRFYIDYISESFRIARTNLESAWEESQRYAQIGSKVK